MSEDDGSPDAPLSLSGPAWLEAARVQAPWAEIEGRLGGDSTLVSRDGRGAAGGEDGRESRGRRSTSPVGGSGRCGTSPGGLYRREVAAYELSRRPRPRRRARRRCSARRPRRAPAPCSASSTRTSTEHYFTLLERGAPLPRPAAGRIAGFDLLANNADRKGGHILVDWEGTAAGGSTTACASMSTASCAPSCGSSPRRRCRPGSSRTSSASWPRGLPDEVAELLTRAESEAVLERAAQLADAGVFPEPLGDRPPR